MCLISLFDYSLHYMKIQANYKQKAICLLYCIEVVFIVVVVQLLYILEQV